MKKGIYVLKKEEENKILTISIHQSDNNRRKKYSRKILCSNKTEKKQEKLPAMPVR